MPLPLRLLLFAVAWVGHAAAWTALLSHLYGRPLPKLFLRLWRLLTGVLILAFPLLVGSIRIRETDAGFDFDGVGSEVAGWYTAGCVLFGGVVVPAVTAYRLLRRTPAAVLAERSEVIDFGARLGPAAVGDGKFAALARLPLNNVLKVEFTDLTLRLKWLPAPLEGLTILAVSDLHFHGTPSREWFDALFDHLAARPKPDVLALIGDYVDTDTHHDWIRPLVGKLGWTEVGLAILGNHDIHHHPDRVRAELTALGLTVLENRWQVVPVRGVPVVVVGHEGPWFRPPPSLLGAPLAGFRLCLSHTPDNFYWACDNSIDLVLCGHVHGGGIRVPVVGSIFVPSVYGRRFDQGVFERGRTVMAVGRGVSGREVTRIGTTPQVLRLTLTAGDGRPTPRATPADVAVRVLGPADGAVLAEVADDVFDHPVDPRWAGEFLADPRHHLAVAVADGRVVGMASGVHYVHPDKPPELWVNEVGVAPAYRNRGVGRRLLAALFDRGRAAGCATAWVGTEVDNAPARRMYAAAGGVEDADPFVLVTFRLDTPRSDPG